MNARKRGHSHWVLDHARFSLQQTDVKVRFCRFCFCEIDDGSMVGIYLEVTRRHFPSTWIQNDL